MPSFLDLPPMGTCSYGDFTFSAAAKTIGFSVTPVWDLAQRTIVYSTYRITIEDYLNGNPGDPVAKAAISQLTAPAAPLSFTGRALSPVVVNEFLGKIRDAKWGPKPISCDVTPYGENVSKLVWTVETSLATCDDASYTGPYEFNFKLTFDIDKAGYTKRTYSGHIRIAVTRLSPSDRTLPDDADSYRNQCVPPLLPGFRRVSQSYELDDAKTTERFHIVDEEIAGNYPPQGVLECSASHTYATQGSWVRWMGTLAAEYEVVRGNGIGYAITAFTALLKQRITIASAMEMGVGIPKATAAGLVTPIPWSYEVEDVSIYGKLKARFRCSYTFSNISLKEILRSGGLWTPVIDPATGKEASPVTFNQFVRVVNGPRGYAGLVFSTSDDGLFDLCGTNPTVVTYTKPAPGSPPTYPLPGYSDSPESPGYPTSPGSSSQQQQLQEVFPPPSQESSWMLYDCDVALGLDAGTVTGKTLPQSPIAAPTAMQDTWDVMTGVPNGVLQSSAFPPVGSQLNQNQSPSQNQQNNQSQNQQSGGAFVQQRTQPVLYITLFGRALRAGYQIPVPQLTQVNGQTPTLISTPMNGDGWRTGIVRNCGVPIYAAQWKLTYVLTNPGNGPVIVPPNPSLA